MFGFAGMFFLREKPTIVLQSIDKYAMMVLSSEDSTP